MKFRSWFLDTELVIGKEAGDCLTLPLLIHACQHYAKYQEDAYWFRLEVP
jgi:hypothetical protein